MNETNEKKVLLSLKNVEVKFNVRGRILTAIPLGLGPDAFQGFVGGSQLHQGLQVPDPAFPGLDGFFFGLQGAGLAFLLAFADSGHAVGDHDGNQDTHGFIPMGFAGDEQGHLDHQGHQQDDDHLVLEAVEQLFPQGIRGDLGQGVGAVQLPALFHLLLGETIEFHGIFPF